MIFIMSMMSVLGDVQVGINSRAHVQDEYAEQVRENLRAEDRNQVLNQASKQASKKAS